jgi:hypothetical protein
LPEFLDVMLDQTPIERRIMQGFGWQSVSRKCHLPDPRSRLENRVTVDGDERPLSPVRDLFQRDELAFEKGFEIRTVQID